jgi:nucleoside-diphosphate-sugar epimerase
MARVVVLGGTGHIGGYLVPRLVEAGHEVTVVTRGKSDPYRAHAAWRSTTLVTADRDDDSFAARVVALEPDVVIDLICFTLDSAQVLVDALPGKIRHFLHCGTIWVHGPSVEVPTTEDAPRRPFGDYGMRKAEIEAWLLDQAHRHGFPATILHPGHISGPGWPPINPAGHLNLAVFETLAAGEELLLPNLGLETLHHVHADDVARSFTAAMANRSVAIGESFHVVSPAALTLRGYAEAVAGWYGQTAHLAFAGWEEWRRTVAPREAGLTWDHIAHSPNASIAKAARLLDYRPRYSSLETIRESLEWLAERGSVPALP